MLWVTDPQDGFYGRAPSRIGHGPVDVTEGVESEEAVKGKQPFPVKFDQPGDEALGNGVSFDDTQNPSAFR